MDTSVERRGITPRHLLIAAGLALVVAAAGTAAFPRLVAVGAAPAVLTVLRASIVVCFATALLLPVAAIVRRLVR
ncbi:hypothetical protein GCM10009828_068340 [Actinoplanes couchii]